MPDKENSAPAKVRKRLRMLGTLELVNIPLQAVVWFGTIGFPRSFANLLGFSLFALLLLEGAGYWFAKLHQSRHRGPLPGLDLFRFANRANVAVLAAGVAVTGVLVARDPGQATIPGLCFALVAVLEHINYFHVQLMHDTTADMRRLLRSGFRRSHLSRELRG